MHMLNRCFSFLPGVVLDTWQSSVLQRPYARLFGIPKAMPQTCLASYPSNTWSTWAGGRCLAQHLGTLLNSKPQLMLRHGNIVAVGTLVHTDEQGPSVDFASWNQTP
jgi:hypothetical protein